MNFWDVQYRFPLINFSITVKYGLSKEGFLGGLVTLVFRGELGGFIWDCFPSNKVDIFILCVGSKCSISLRILLSPPILNGQTVIELHFP